MRYAVFVATFVSYMAIHSMRMSVSFVQADIIDYFDIGKSQMGLAMSAVYIIMGISYLVRTFVPLTNLQFTYLLTVGLASLAYALIPLSVTFAVRSIVVLFVSLGLFGLFQSSTWPLLLKILNKYFHPEEDGGLVGLWSSNGDLGNILGFFACTIIQFYIKLSWEVCLYFSSTLGLILAVAVYLLPIDHPQELDENFLQQNHAKALCNQYIKVFKSPILIITATMLCLIKSLLYGVLLWLPMYLAEGGFGDFKGYIPIVMSTFSIIGSIFMGFVYQHIHSPFTKSTIIIMVQTLMVASFYGIRLLDLLPENKWWYVGLIGLIGFCLGGSFNVLVTHEPLIIAREQGIGVSSFSSLLMALGNTSVGILEIIIGFAVSKSTDSIFTIFFIVSIMCLVLYVARTLLFWCTHSGALSMEPQQYQQIAEKI